MTPDPRPLSAENDLLARLAVFGRLLEAEWYNGNVDEGAYLRLNADLTGLVAVYVRPTIDATRASHAALVEALEIISDGRHPDGHRGAVLVARAALDEEARNAD